MEIKLVKRHRDYIEQAIADGQFYDAGDVIHFALDLLIDVEANPELKKARLLAALDEGRRQCEAGEFADYSLEDTIKRMLERAEAEDAEDAERAA